MQIKHARAVEPVFGNFSDETFFSWECCSDVVTLMIVLSVGIIVIIFFTQPVFKFVYLRRVI